MHAPERVRITAQRRDLIARLQLEPHPEGGWYREVHRSATLLQTARGPRAALTSIYFLLEQHQHSRWHVVTSDEVWHFAGGAPLELLSYQPGFAPVPPARARPTAGRRRNPSRWCVPANGRRRAACGDWSLVGCDVGAGLRLRGFLVRRLHRRTRGRFHRRARARSGLL